MRRIVAALAFALIIFSGTVIMASLTHGDLVTAACAGVAFVGAVMAFLAVEFR